MFLPRREMRFFRERRWVRVDTKVVLAELSSSSSVDSFAINIIGGERYYVMSA